MKRSLGVGCVLAVIFLGFAVVSSASTKTQPPSPEASLAAVFAGASLASPDFIPAPTNKCGLFCDTTSSSTSATVSGSGYDCTSAQSDLTSQLQTLATADCRNETGFGHCNFVVQDTTACTMTVSGTYQIGGYATYSCRDSSCIH